VLQCFVACCSALQRLVVCAILFTSDNTCKCSRRGIQSVDSRECDAVCCGVSQCVAVCCSVMQYVVACCGVLPCVTMSCSVMLQRVAACCGVFTN